MIQIRSISTTDIKIMSCVGRYQACTIHISPYNFYIFFSLNSN